MCADRGCADHIDAELFTTTAKLGVQVEHDFQVIGDKTDWHDHDVADRRLCVLRLDEITNIGLKPRLLRRTTAALVRKLPIAAAERVRNKPARFVQLSFVTT